MIQHPFYTEHLTDWLKFRRTLEGGRTFIDAYLKRFSARETQEDFDLRKSITYCPSHAKSAIIEIKNSIFERLSDVLRVGGPQSYQIATEGNNGGVDYAGNSMTSFIGTEILLELLAMQRVGVFVDKAPLPDKRTRAEDRYARPYLYAYRTEDILSWAYNSQNELISVLLRSEVDEIDEQTGLISGRKEEYKLLRKVGEQVIYADYVNEQPTNERVLKLTRIPFVIFSLTESLMRDIADYQIALLNLESSDLGYLLKSNFPFYTEQTSPLADMAGLARAASVTVDADGKPVVSQQATDAPRKVEIGIAGGRTYPKGLDRPDFIHPSPEPMEVSMAKQNDMKMAIRQLVQLALTNLAPQRASADSKDKDQQGLEAGLANIGLALQIGENQIAEIWAEYEAEDPAVIAYPDKYSLRTDAERLDEAEKLAKRLPSIPSITAQKEIVKKIAFLVCGRGLSLANEQAIIREIDAAQIIAIDPEVLLKDLEAGLVAAETASKARGYPEGDVAKAKKEHIERLAAIAIAQAPGGGAGAARGLPAGPQDDSAKDEKKNSQDADKQDLGAGEATRGEGK
jgi:hypothetical protein